MTAKNTFLRSLHGDSWDEHQHLMHPMFLQVIFIFYTGLGVLMSQISLIYAKHTGEFAVV